MFVVHFAAEITLEADALAGGDAVVAEHRDEQRSEVAAVHAEALLRETRLAEWCQADGEQLFDERLDFAVAVGGVFYVFGAKAVR